MMLHKTHATNPEENSLLVTRDNFDPVTTLLLSHNTETLLRIIGIPDYASVGWLNLASFGNNAELIFGEGKAAEAQPFFERLLAKIGTPVSHYGIMIRFPAPVTTQQEDNQNQRITTYFLFSTDTGIKVLYNENPDVENIVTEVNEALPLDTPSSESNRIVLQNLNTALYALFLKKSIAIPAGYPLPEAFAHIGKEKELITELAGYLIPLAPEPVAVISNQLQALYKNPVAFITENPDYFEDDDLDFEIEELDESDTLEPGPLTALALIGHIPQASSDWKFDAEGFTMHLRELTGQEIRLQLPQKELYGQQLFPYAQEALAHKGLKLFNYDTLGDDYLFLVVPLQHADRIQWICRQLDFPIAAL